MVPMGCWLNGLLCHPGLTGETEDRLTNCSVPGRTDLEPKGELG